MLELVHRILSSK